MTILLPEALERQTKWDQRYLELAKHYSTWSKDPSSKCGAVIVRPNNTICSFGFNGFPKKMNDDEKLYKDRQIKLDFMVHAEENAILFAKEDLGWHSIFVYPYPPCCRCATSIVQSGIKRVVTTQNEPERWKESFDHARWLYKETGVELIQYVFE